MANQFDFEKYLGAYIDLNYDAIPASTAQPGSKSVRHEVVCRHWLKGVCVKQWKCDFLHIYDDSRMPYCRNQKRHGRCSDQLYGLCPLRHSETPLVEPHAMASSTGPSSFVQGRKTGAADLICLRYLFGYCPCGPACHLKHVKLGRADLQTKLHAAANLPDWYLYLVLSSPDFPKLSGPARLQTTSYWLNLAEQLSGGASPTPPLQPLPTLMPPYLLNLENIPTAAGSTQAPPPTTGMVGAGGAGGSDKIRCFVIKSGKIENILTSVQRGIWATGRGNMLKLQHAWASCSHVLLLMSANESGGYQGYARMASGFDDSLYPGIWGSFSAKLSPNFRVQWLKQAKLDFDQLSAYANPFNDNKPLKKSRDGQELPLELAEIICNRLWRQPSEDLLQGTPHEKLPRINHDTFFRLAPAQRLSEELSLGLRTGFAPPPDGPPPPVRRRLPPPNTQHWGGGQPGPYDRRISG